MGPWSRWFKDSFCSSWQYIIQLSGAAKSAEWRVSTGSAAAAAAIAVRADGVSELVPDTGRPSTRTASAEPERSEFEWLFSGPSLSPDLATRPLILRVVLEVLMGCAGP